MNLYTEDGINQAIEIARKAYNATAMTIFAASDTVEEAQEKMKAITTLNDLFVNTFKSVLYEGRGGRPSVKKER